MGPSVKPQTPTPPPTIDDAKAQAQATDQVLQRKGRAATFVSNAQGQSAGGVGTKMILGQGA